MSSNLTSFADHLDEQYGKKGTDEREAYEKGFETFKQEVIKSKRPTATIDPALNEYTDKIVFTNKYEKAKKVFETIKLPPNKNK